MNTVSIVGLIVGPILILFALVALLRGKKLEFDPNITVFTIIGFLLIGMSQWGSINVKAPGDFEIQLEALQNQVTQTADAVSDVAAVTDSAAVAVETTRRQLATITTQLATRNLMTAGESAAVRNALQAAPRPNTRQLRDATRRLDELKIPRR